MCYSVTKLLSLLIKIHTLFSFYQLVTDPTMAMVIPGYEKKLSEPVVDLLHNYAEKGAISHGQMKDIAMQMGDKTFGRHKYKEERGGWNRPGAELRDILWFWWEEELHKLDRTTALTKLIYVLEHDSVDLTSLAYDIKKIQLSPSLKRSTRFLGGCLSRHNSKQEKVRKKLQINKNIAQRARLVRIWQDG